MAVKVLRWSYYISGNFGNRLQTYAAQRLGKAKTLTHPVGRTTLQRWQFATQNATLTYSVLLSFPGSTALSGPWPPHYRGFTITLRHTALGSTPLDDWSVCRRDLYLTTHNTQTRQTSTPPAGFEPTIQARERPHTHVLNGAGTVIGIPLIATDYTGQQNSTFFFVLRTSIGELSSTFYAEFRYAYRIFLSGRVSKIQRTLFVQINNNKIIIKHAETYSKM